MEHKSAEKTVGYVVGTALLALILLLVGGITTGVLPLRESYAQAVNTTPEPIGNIAATDNTESYTEPTPNTEITVPDTTLEEEKPVYTVTVTFSKGGTVIPYGMSTVVENGSIAVVAIPDEGYAIENMVIDGVSMGAIDSFMLENVHENHSFYVSFKRTIFTPTTPEPGTDNTVIQPPSISDGTTDTDIDTDVDIDEDDDLSEE